MFLKVTKKAETSEKMNFQNNRQFLRALFHND